MEKGFPRDGRVPGVFPDRKPRTAEVLIAMRDQHWEQFSDAEMDILFQHLREQGGCDPEYDEGEWVTLQVYLRGLGVPITIFHEFIDGCATPSLRHLSNLFHHLWTKHRKGYQKMGWKVFVKQLVIRKIYV